MGFWYRSVLVLIASLMATAMSYASVPERLEYQGYLTDAVGTPIHCQGCAAPYTFKFSLYDQQAEGNLLWTEIHAGVDIKDGVFRVELGVEEPLQADILDDVRWLEIQINGQAPLVPRQRVISVPYALRADLAERAVESENAVTLGGLPPEDFVQVTDTDEFLTESELEEVLESLGYVPGDNDTLGDMNTCNEDEIIKWNGTDWVCAVNADTDTLSSLLCAAGEIVFWDGSTWICSAVLDVLQSNIDQVQTNLNTLDSSLAPVAKAGSFSSLTGVPADLLDGDADSFAALACSNGQMLRHDGSSWSCVNHVDQIGTLEPAPCGPSTIGKIYYDLTGNSLRVCDGTAYRKIKICNEICPPPSSVGCGLDVLDNCGESCGATGEGLNLDQCADPSTVTCGAIITDNCGNECPNQGTGLNPDQCDPDTVACGVPVVDSCGNSCGSSGLNAAVCDDGNTCTSDTCDPVTGCTHTLNLPCYGDGTDGALVVDSTVHIDPVKSRINGAADAGSTSLLVSNPVGFTAGSYVLVIDIRGPHAGNYETNQIESIDGDTIHLTSALVNSYCTSPGCPGSDHQKAQIIQISQYTDVTVQNGGTITADPWNGEAGGVIAFMATGTVTVESGGHIDADGLGYRGGGAAVGQCANGQQGESYNVFGVAGVPGNNDGGGGAGLGQADTGNSGGGGAHRTAGSVGQTSLGASSGSGGTTYGVNDLSQIFMGSGGGSGGTDCETDGVASTSGAGGNGGGIIIIIAPNIEPGNGVTARGSNGLTADAGPNGGETGGGGAGAGGAVLFITDDPASLSADVIGGEGSPGAADTLPYGLSRGGDGGAGYVHKKPL